MRKKVILLIPLTFNDGAPVPKELRSSIHSQLYAFAGGLKVVGTVEGSYRMADGTRQNDVLEQVWVVLMNMRFPR
jgi:hypothetical protein